MMARSIHDWRHARQLCLVTLEHLSSMSNQDSLDPLSLSNQQAIENSLTRLLATKVESINSHEEMSQDPMSRGISSLRLHSKF